MTSRHRRKTDPQRKGMNFLSFNAFCWVMGGPFVFGTNRCGSGN